MEKEKNYLLREANLRGIENFLNKNFVKSNGGGFTIRDVKDYVERGNLPKYLGDYKIELIHKQNCTIKLYNIIGETCDEIKF